MLDQRFASSLQIMQSLLLARRESAGPISSTVFAVSLATNPVLVRRQLARLRAAGLIAVRRGRGGGVVLARDGHRIALGDIYLASVEQRPLWARRHDLPARCSVSRNFEAYFDRLTAQADAALLEMLAGITLADSLDRALGAPQF